jgi:hypothetical protein
MEAEQSFALVRAENAFRIGSSGTIHSDRAVRSDANVAHICVRDASRRTLRGAQVTARVSIGPACQRAIGLHRGHCFRGHRFRSQRFHICVAAFVINVAATSSARALAGGG